MNTLILNNQIRQNSGTDPLMTISNLSQMGVTGKKKFLLINPSILNIKYTSLSHNPTQKEILPWKYQMMHKTHPRDCKHFYFK